MQGPLREVELVIKDEYILLIFMVSMDIIDERLCILSSLKNHIEAAPTRRSAQRIGGPESWRAGYKRGTLHIAPVALSSQHALQDCESNYFFCWKIQSLSPFLIVGENVTSKKNQQ